MKTILEHTNFLYIVGYFLGALLFETALQVTMYKDTLILDEEIPRPVVNITIFLWPFALGGVLIAGFVMGLVFTFVSAFKVYQKYVIENLRAKYKKHIWEKKNAEAFAKEEARRQRRA